jgi:hypothetical protein
MADTDEDATLPNAKSSGNEGARGSRGQANSGAQPGNSTNQDGNERERTDGAPDLRKDDAQGGGGAGSNSSRSG